MNIFRKMTFICGLFVLLSACGITEMVTFENSEYSDMLEAKSIDRVKYKEYLFNDAYYIAQSKAYTHDTYRIWLVKMGSSTADNKVIVDRVLIKLADKTVNHVLDTPTFEKAFNAKYELLVLYDLDFNQEPFKSVSDQSPLYVHVTFKVGGVEQTRIYTLNRVVQKMVIYPT